MVTSFAQQKIRIVYLWVVFGSGNINGVILGSFDGFFLGPLKVRILLCIDNFLYLIGLHHFHRKYFCKIICPFFLVFFHAFVIIQLTVVQNIVLGGSSVITTGQGCIFAG